MKGKSKGIDEDIKQVDSSKTGSKYAKTELLFVLLDLLLELEDAELQSVALLLELVEEGEARDVGAARARLLAEVGDLLGKLFDFGLFELQKVVEVRFGHLEAIEKALRLFELHGRALQLGLHLLQLALLSQRVRNTSKIKIIKRNKGTGRPCT
jgi:hypothetical protein